MNDNSLFGWIFHVFPAVSFMRPLRGEEEVIDHLRGGLSTI